MCYAEEPEQSGGRLDSDGRSLGSPAESPAAREAADKNLSISDVSPLAAWCNPASQVSNSLSSKDHIFLAHSLLRCLPLRWLLSCENAGSGLLESMLVLS